MVTPGFICDVCGKAGTDKTAIEKHESIPVKELTMGGLYRVQNTQSSHEVLLFVRSEVKTNEEHYKEYMYQAFNVVNDPLGIEDTNSYSHYYEHLPDILEELAVEDFEKYKDIVLGNTYVRHAIDHFSYELSIGTLPKCDSDS